MQVHVCMHCCQFARFFVCLTSEKEMFIWNSVLSDQCPETWRGTWRIACNNIVVTNPSPKSALRTCYHASNCTWSPCILDPRRDLPTAFRLVGLMSGDQLLRSMTIPTCLCSTQCPTWSESCLSLVGSTGMYVCGHATGILNETDVDRKQENYNCNNDWRSRTVLCNTVSATGIKLLPFFWLLAIQQPMPSVQYNHVPKSSLFGCHSCLQCVWLHVYEFVQCLSLLVQNQSLLVSNDFNKHHTSFQGHRWVPLV